MVTIRVRRLSEAWLLTSKIWYVQNYEVGKFQIFIEVFYQAYCTHNMAISINHALHSIKESTFHYYPLNITHPLLGPYRMDLKVSILIYLRSQQLYKAVTAFKTTLAAAAGKIKTCHHLLQISNVAVHKYPALQLI